MGAKEINPIGLLVTSVVDSVRKAVGGSDIVYTTRGRRTTVRRKKVESKYREGQEVESEISLFSTGVRVSAGQRGKIVESSGERYRVRWDNGEEGWANQDVLLGESALKPKPVKKEWLRLADYTTASPYRGGYIISSHGEHMGTIKKTSKGWKYDPLKMGTDPEGKKLRIAAAEIDARESAPAGERKFV